MSKLILFAVFSALLPFLAHAQGLVFVVNKNNPASEISLDELADYYFKRRVRWPDGTKVQFIDQKEGSARREEFLSLLGRTQRDVDLYWIGEKNFSGASAPLRAPSDDLVLSMVSALPGAIGYVADTHEDLSKAKRIKVKKRE